MNLNADQFVATGKANLDTAIELSAKLFEGMEKLVDLQLQAARATLSESADHAKAVMTVKDPQEFFALQSALVQPAAEKSAAYGRQVYEIASATQAELSKVVEAQFAGVQHSLMSLVDTAMKNAPAGSENATAMMKSAVTAANSAIENIQKAAKQAASVAEANFTALSASATNAAKAATTAPKSRRTAA